MSPGNDEKRLQKEKRATFFFVVTKEPEFSREI